MAVVPRPASAVMLLRNGRAGGEMEVFMVRRVVQSEFMPDVYVFPGGSIKADDRAAEEKPQLCAPVPARETVADPEGRTALGTGARAAAIRELFEEAGVLLAYRNGALLALAADEAGQARFAEYRRAFHERRGSLVELVEREGLQLATDQLHYFAHWLTPEGMPRRFDTHFFLALAPSEQQAAYDQLETSDGLWIRPAEALARSQDGSFPLVFATLRQLEELATFARAEEALAFAASHYVPLKQPRLVQEDGRYRIYLPGDERGWEVPPHMTQG
ncbi:NUDIX hydrolase [Thermogemmatispora sp.]|uniref:NUDIX hydrolase n=1 Tax=Thermogemmatispora sp. TaxID=1968838 RepID=UPI0035E40D5A